jgi:hypothetical protein
MFIRFAPEALSKCDAICVELSAALPLQLLITTTVNESGDVLQIMRALNAYI